MSGNPNPPPARRPSRGGGGGSGDDCDFRFRTQLASPQATAVAQLTAGDVLPVEIRQQDGVRIIAAVTAAGDVVGSIVDNIDRLLACMQSGHHYEAAVGDVSGGAVRVDVAPAS